MCQGLDELGVARGQSRQAGLAGFGVEHNTWKRREISDVDV